MKPHRSWLGVALDSFLIFLLTAAVIRPLFKVKYTIAWHSIESTFIADGRFLKAHWPHPLWQPLWYCGTRFDYIYPPALRYGTAALAKLFPILPVRAYHLYISLFYCVGIVSVYLLVRLAAESRGTAWLAALATLLLSPSFLLMRQYRVDSWHLMPQRLNVLTQWGEGPHISALALLPLALLCTFLALGRWRPALLALAAVFSAWVVSINFYGATALAIFFSILVWSVWVTHRNNLVWLRAAGIAAVAYGLTAFWLVPSYLQITLRNMQFVSRPGNGWSRWVALAVAVALGTVTFRFVRGRRELAWFTFVCGSAAAFALLVLGQYYFDFRLIGEPLRLVPELDLALILLLAECLRRLWAADPPRPHFPFSPSLWTRLAALFLVVASFATCFGYLRHARGIVLSDPDYRRRVEYQVTDWIAKNLPGARSLATGSVRFWYDTWSDLAQMHGGSDQGLMNGLVQHAYFFVTNNPDASAGVRLMQALGVDAVIVHDKNSQEIYHDYSNPRKFDGILTEIYNDHQGNIIYKTPRRYPGLAHIVEARQFQSLPPIQSVVELDRLRAYTDAVENGPDVRASAQWDGTDAMILHANLQPGQSILVQETYDPNWHAYASGRTLPVHADPVGFMWIEAPPGEQTIRLQFETPLENQIGWAVTLASGAIVLGLLALGSKSAATFRRGAVV